MAYEHSWPLNFQLVRREINGTYIFLTNILEYWNFLLCFFHFFSDLHEDDYSESRAAFGILFKTVICTMKHTCMIHYYLKWKLDLR